MTYLALVMSASLWIWNEMFKYTLHEQAWLSKQSGSLLLS